MIEIVILFFFAVSPLFGQPKTMASGETLEAFVLQLVKARPWRVPPKQLLQRLGTVTRVEVGPDGSVDCYVYEHRIPKSRAVIRVCVNNGGKRVDTIEISNVELSIPAAKQSFGSALRIVQYTFDDCLNDGESAPIFESVKGSLAYLEDRAKGLYMKISSGAINIIVVQGKPIGYKVSKCRK